jgi:hypothetical protein
MESIIPVHETIKRITNRPARDKSRIKDTLIHDFKLRIEVGKRVTPAFFRAHNGETRPNNKSDVTSQRCTPTSVLITE